MKSKLVLLIAGSLLGAPAAFSANIIDSIYGAGAGSFEIPDPNITNYATYQQGSTAITGWTVGQNSIDWVRSTVWNASDGSYSLDMNGTAPEGDPPDVGSISTIIPTTAGTTYQVSFDISGFIGFTSSTNPKEMEVSVEAVDLSNIVSQISTTQLQLFATNNSETLPLALNWETRTLTFVATQAQTKVTFLSKTTTNHSAILLDNVSIQAVPEPGAVSLLGAAALLLATRRTRRG